MGWLPGLTWSVGWEREMIKLQGARRKVFVADSIKVDRTLNQGLVEVIIAKC